MSLPDPRNAHRPLQIIPPFETWAGRTDRAIRERIDGLRAAGLGGLVTNVSLENYLRDESAWDVFVRGVKIAHEAGLRVWIYDEQGYPSGAAGGRVLEEYPEGEAVGLIRREGPAGEITYDVIPLYEATHATENFYKKRHYPNILDPKAVATFLRVTHERYARALEPIGAYVEAFFTDEPSLISVYVPKDRDYPVTLPWHVRLPEIFRARKGYDLLPHRERLFVDVDGMDRKVRCDFYEVVADLCAETYFGQLQEWCHARGVASSGHLLGEETMVWQIGFDGSPFPSYRKFDIPGIDMILSDPEKIMAKEYFLVPKIAGSAARLQGKRRVMCEISDFFGQMEKHPASMEQMLCTAGILFSFGVTEILSYYPLSLGPEGERKPTDLSPAAYRRYTDFTTRLNDLFAAGTISNRIAVLYPITSVWAHFTPSHRSMYEPHPDPTVRHLDEGFASLCRSLLAHQIDYDIVDERSLASAQVGKGSLLIGERTYDALLLPPADTIYLRTMEVMTEFVRRGGTLLASPLVPEFAAEGPTEDERVRERMKALRAAGALGGAEPGSSPLAYLTHARIVPECVFEPAAPGILCTTVARAGDRVIVLVNVSAGEYRGSATLRSPGPFRLYDPSTMEDRPLAGTPQGTGSKVDLTLSPFATVCLVGREEGR